MQIIYLSGLSHQITIVCIYAALFLFVAAIVHLNHVFKS